MELTEACLAQLELEMIEDPIFVNQTSSNGTVVARVVDYPLHSDKLSNTKKRNQQAMSAGTENMKKPNQVFDHIVAKKNKRQLLTQRFIALSTIVPGLKKMDETIVLGETIKYVKELQDKVSELEEVVAKKRVKSVVLVEESQLVVDGDGAVDDNESICNGDDGCISQGDDSDGSSNDTLPKIEVMVSDKIVLLKIYCKKQKGVLEKLFSEIEKHDMDVLNSSAVAFGNLFLNIDIVAQMEKGFNNNMKKMVTTLRSTL